MEIILKITALVLSGGILYVGYLARRVSGTWLTPASIWCVGWFVLTFIPLLLAISAPINPISILYILSISVVFCLPVLGVDWKRVTYYIEETGGSSFDTGFLRISFYVLSAIAIISLSIHLSIQGVTLASLTTNFFETSSSLIVDRYTQSTIENIFAQISNIFTYAIVGLGGLIFLGYRSFHGKVLVIILAMAPSLALMTIAGAKGTIFLCIALFYGGVLVRRMRAGDNRLIDAVTLKRGLLGLLALLPFVTISFLSRGLYEEASRLDLTSSLYRNFISYSSAHVYAFSDWFSWKVGFDSNLFYARDELTGGFFTFMSLFKALGSTREVPPGYYDEYFQYSWFLQTNIYTIFRGLITDFSLIGSFVFMYFIGFLSNSMFVRLVSNGNSSWGVAFYIIFCGFVYTSFLISIFVWSSMYPVFAILGVLLVTNNGLAATRAKQLGIGERCL